MDTDLRDLFDRRGRDLSVPAGMPPSLRRKVRWYRVRMGAAIAAVIAVVAVGTSLTLPDWDRSTPVHPAPSPATGVPDPSFGTNGVVVDSSVGISGPAAIESDGSIVAVGAEELSQRSFLTRYRADGTRDSDFGEGGRVPLHDLSANDVAIASDGHIVVAGATIAGDAFVIARFMADGSTDTGFGDGGRVESDLTPEMDIAFGVAIQPDGGIVTAGVAGVRGMFRGNPTTFVAVYDANGAVDPTFGSGGIVTTDVSKSDDRLSALAIQPDGKIVATGASNAYRAGLLIRYQVNGALDRTFGDGGVVTAAHRSFTALAVQPDGKIVVTSADEDDPGISLSRYDSDGPLDLTFGDKGIAVATFRLSTRGFATLPSTAVALQEDGAIVVGGGIAIERSETDFVLGRFRPDGTLDSSFGDGGKVVTALSNGNDYASDIAVLPDGKIVAVGTDEVQSEQSATRHIVLARFI